MVQLLNRKRFANTLGVAGLGLMASAVGAPSAMAQKNRSHQCDEDGKDFYVVPGLSPADIEEMRVEVYNEFTQALADELGIDDPDEVDAAIRSAMMSGVDANDGLSKEGAEEMKALIAAADHPIGPTIRGWGG